MSPKSIKLSESYYMIQFIKHFESIKIIGTENRSGGYEGLERERGLITYAHEGGFISDGNILYLNCG